MQVSLLFKALYALRLYMQSGGLLTSAAPPTALLPTASFSTALLLPVEVEVPPHAALLRTLVGPDAGSLAACREVWKKANK